MGLAVRATDPAGKRQLDAHGKRVQDELEARREAESARLLYVAVTRARDLLVLCGEGKGRSWRSKLERALQGTSGLVVRLPLPPPAELEPAIEPEPAPPPAMDAPPRPIEPPRAKGRRRGAEGQLDLFLAAPPPREPPPAADVPALAPLTLAPGRFVSAVTELAELVRCERRFFYKQVVGLEELPGRAPEPDGDPDELDRLERGHLAHRLLEKVDLAWAARDPAGAVTTALERDPARGAPEAAAVAADVRALLESPFGRQLARAPKVWREVPFVLEASGAGSTLVLRGQIDLMFVDGDGIVNVVDHKHASAAGQPRDAYAFQLATYALAASRVLPGESRLRTGLAWLKDRGAGPVLRDVGSADLRAHEEVLSACAGKLGRIRDTGHHARLAGPAACGDCGFRARCWGPLGA
jgi:ATP-dependent exoDNAse (exonuclease V) beta subunit